jgi:hypothetical protein
MRLGARDHLGLSAATAKREAKVRADLRRMFRLVFMVIRTQEHNSVRGYALSPAYGRHPGAVSPKTGVGIGAIPHPAVVLALVWRPLPEAPILSSRAGVGSPGACPCAPDKTAGARRAAFPRGLVAMLTGIP